MSRFVRRRRWAHIIRRTAVAADLLVVWFIISCVVDRWLPLPTMFRLISLSAISLVVISLIAPAIWRLGRRFDWMTAGEAIERDDPRFAGRLATVISTSMLAESLRGSGQLREVLEVETIKLIDLPSTIQSEFHSSRIPLIAFAILASMLLVGSLLHRATASVLLIRQLAPLVDQAPATAITLRLLPGDISHLAGEPFVVTLHADGADDVVPVLQFVLGDQPPASAVMPATSDGYAYNFAAIDQSMSYRVRAGVVTTPWYKVTTIAPPAAVAPISAAQPVATQRAKTRAATTKGATTESAATQSADDPAAIAYLKAIRNINPTTAPK